VNQCLRRLAVGLVLCGFANLTALANPLTEEQLYDIACTLARRWADYSTARQG
jgi:hypothetical protein